MAFIMHSLSWLASNGTAAIVCFPGILYRGGAERKIRKYLVENNFIDCVVQLPSNLFFGTSIATCIMVMKKNKSDSTTLFIDATSECIKVTNNNKLTPENISRIVDTFAERKEIAHFSHLADITEITENDFNLSVSTYVEAEDTREKIDIQKLNAEIAEIVLREEELRAAIDAIIEEIEINIDYILMLVKKYHDTHCEDKEVLVTIQKAIDASPELRSKKNLINTFLAGINDVDDVLTKWHQYVAEEREKELEQIIREEKLKDMETRKFLENAFRDGEVKTTGTELDKILPPVSRFGGTGRAKKKQSVVDQLKRFFERFFGIGGTTFTADKTVQAEEQY